jgi:ferredoxin--NADP+ reductase
MLSTGTGLAPFMSIIKDPEIYDQFDRVILTHGVREISELAYADYIENVLPNDEHLGEIVREKLVYYPTVTREPYKNNGRLTELMTSGKLFLDLKQPHPNLDDDRFMICGSPSMIKDLVAILKSKDFTEARNNKPGHYVIERAFVES